MKKLFLAVAVLLVGSVTQAGVLADFGAVKVMMPFSSVNAVYQFDGVAKQSLVGAETPLFTAWKLEFTGGAVTSVGGEGSPFVGLNLAVDNPLSNYLNFGEIKPGIFAGRNFRDSEWMVGAKASVNIFQ